MADQTVSPNRGIMIALSYVWILALVPLLVEKNDSEIQWHAKHGLVLMVAELLFWIAYSIVTNILAAVTLGFGYLLFGFTPLFLLIFFVVHVVAMAKGLQGSRLIIPGVSEYASRF